MGALSTAITSFCFFTFNHQLRRVCWAVSCAGVGCTTPKKCGDFPEVNASAKSPLQVVLPSMGQTATTSLSLATRYMGYKSFHIEERYVYAHRSMWDVEDNEEFRRAIAGCKVESLALEPPTDSLPHAIQTAPHAKFIMTWRDFNERTKSSLGVIANFTKDGKHGRWASVVWDVAKSIAFCPWLSVYDAMTGRYTQIFAEGTEMVAPEQTTPLLYLAQRLMGKFGVEDVDNAKDRGNHKINHDEEAYLGHQDEIRRTVPPGQLLEFNPKRHGWAELERFLGRPAPKDRPFPHPRSKASWTNDSMFDNRMDVGVQLLAIFLVLHVVNYSMLHICVRAALRLLCKCGCLPRSWVEPRAQH